MSIFKEMQIRKELSINPLPMVPKKENIPSFFVKYTVLLILISLSDISSVAQNTVYTPLYNSANFIKTIDFSKPVGEIQGEVSANASGGVTYTIPIYTCPGTNGLEPSLSLAYNSQASTGLAGCGWNVSGLSIISRGGKDMYHNGVVQPVNYTAVDDAFLLDGMKLNVISGTNGSNGAIYAGESETYSKIISFTNGSGNNPDWFQITAKEGTIMEFGHSTDSRVLTDNGQNVIFWRLNKIIDINGNYVEFIYDNTDRDSHIQKVRYTGNSITGLLPYNQVNFSYSIRTDQNKGYEAGTSLTSKFLLDKISVVHTNDAGNSQTIKTYKLNYGFDNVHSMLKELIEYGGDETSASLNSTIFLYGDQPVNVTTSVTSQLAGSADFFAGDFDADGKTDLVVAPKYFNQNIGTFLHTSYSLRKDINQNSSILM